MRRRLGILVPYRDREEHLAQFLATTPAYVAADPRSAAVEARFLIVEQAPGGPFNRGALLNVGALTLGDSVDYLCLHDVDTLPVDADYSEAAQPTMIVVHGLKVAPDLARKLLSSVVVVPRAQFVAANGFSNEYWGWGFEDVDLRERLLRCGFRPDHREGAFRLLQHPDLGSNPDGSPSERFRSNQALFLSRWAEAVEGGWRRQRSPSDRWRREGLASLAFATLRPRSPLAGDFPRGALVERMTVDVGRPDAPAPS
jgi:hypothetical protein